MKRKTNKRRRKEKITMRGKSKKEPRIIWAKASQKEEIRKRVKSKGEKNQEARVEREDLLNTVINNAGDLASCIGFDVKTFAQTFANLKTIDVIKSDYKAIIRNDNSISIQPDWIVDQTPGIDTLSEKAKIIIIRELDFLRSIGEDISPRIYNHGVELYPGTFNSPRQVRSDKELEELAKKPSRELTYSDRQSVEKWKQRKEKNTEPRTILPLEEKRIRRLKKIMKPG